MMFDTDEDAMKFIDTKLDEWKCRKIRKPKKKPEDVREKTDPYYAMLKEEQPIDSRFSNVF